VTHTGGGDFAAFSPPAGIVLDFRVTPLDFTTMKFDAELPQPIRLLRQDAARCKLQHVPTELRSVLTIGSECDELSFDAMSLLRNTKSGTSEDGLHGRDDAILQVVTRGHPGWNPPSRDSQTATPRLACTGPASWLTRGRLSCVMQGSSAACTRT
jgi:hypothetical protein